MFFDELIQVIKTQSADSGMFLGLVTRRVTVRAWFQANSVIPGFLSTFPGFNLAKCTDYSAVDK